MKLLIIGALPSSLVNFRGPLIAAMHREGHEVVAAAAGGDTHTEATLATLGATYRPLFLARAAMNPLADIRTFLDIRRLLRRVRPDAVLAYTIKPIVYSALAAKAASINAVFALIEGLGRPFMTPYSVSHRVSSSMAKLLYRAALPTCRKVFFLNPDDLGQFVKDGYVPRDRCVLLNGIGVDLDHYSAQPPPPPSPVRFLLMARLMPDKGILEYVEAARRVKALYPQVEFVLTGDFDEHPSTLRPADVHRWTREGLISYRGWRSDVRPLLKDCHVYVLPSYYREGVPRTLLEAMATGRPLITTDLPGCRETVVRVRSRTDSDGTLSSSLGATRRPSTVPFQIGENGLLVRPRNFEALAAAMIYVIEHPDDALRMGQRSRRYAEERFDVHDVNSILIRELSAARCVPGPESSIVEA